MSKEAEAKGTYSAAKFWVFYVVGLIVVIILYKMCAPESANSQGRQTSRTKGSGTQKAPTAKKLKRE